jgi:aspartyl-tRNA(Asn)/glutamyl-tRNA(Gln) amidotransferase subunit C
MAKPKDSVTPAVDIAKIARLARLHLAPSELEEFKKKLGSVLAYVTELETVTTEKSLNVKHVPKDAVSVREDRALSFSNVDGFFQNTPAQEDRQYSIPTVVEHSS